MATALAQRPRSGYVDRPSGGTLADVVEIILDKGMVIDAFVRVSVLGLELITIDARIVIASCDTYLRWADAVSRLEMGEDIFGTRKPTPPPLCRRCARELEKGEDDDEHDQEEARREGGKKRRQKRR